MMRTVFFRVFIAVLTSAAALSAHAIVVSNGDVELGVWNSGFGKTKAYAEEHHIPLVVFWGDTGCAYCNTLKTAVSTDEFVTWQATCGLVLCQINNKSTDDQKAAKAFVGNGDWPRIAVYWPKQDGSSSKKVFVGRSGQMPNGGKGTLARQFINELEADTMGYSPVPTKAPYSGGQLSDPETEGNRLEFEAGTTAVTVNLTREAKVAGYATNVVLAVAGLDGRVVSTQVVDWAEGVMATNATVAIPAGVVAKAGDRLTLYLEDEGAYVSTNHITYVELENSPANPLWVSERASAKTRSAAPALAFGEWTVDLDGAKALAARENGTVLVSVQGSLWCPDCANTERNFLSLADEKTGANRFADWAVAHKVALVSVDVPNYTGASVSDFKSPTLFSTKAYATTLARSTEFPASGAESNLLSSVTRSGLGYQSRKGITAEEAAAQLAAFHTLVTTNTAFGGFHRPEDSNKNRTGVPIFVMLRADGTVAARFTDFASKSPMDTNRDDFANYLKRFDEMLAIAAASGDHADAAEIENNYPNDGVAVLASDGGEVTGELCTADPMDSFKLDLGGTVEQEIVVTNGASDVSVSVELLQRPGANGEVKSVTAVTGSLSSGVTLTRRLDAGSTVYFVRVKAASGALPPASTNEMNFVGYTVKTATVLIPAETASTATARADAETVRVKLEANTIYRFAGIDTNKVDGVLTIEKSDAGVVLAKAVAAGSFDLPLTQVGGTLEYRIWKPGTVGFSGDLQKTVSETAGVAHLKASRTGGNAGSVKARVTVDLEKTTLAASRYQFDPFDLDWADGDQQIKDIPVTIVNDGNFDGDAVLALTIAVVESELGDVTVTAGKESASVTVEEDDKAAPGFGCVAGASPDYAKPGIVYARSSTGAEIRLARVEANDGEVSVELKSSLADVRYGAEGEHDLKTEGGKTYFVWQHRESGEKTLRVSGIPVGKTAKITLGNVGDFKTIAASNKVSVVSVADDAPGFTEEANAFTLYRYVAPDCRVGLEQTQGGTMTFAKLSGTLPSGLKAVYDAEANQMVLSGTPTAKAGLYVSTWQVTEARKDPVTGRTTRVPGLVAKLTLTVIDPTDAKLDPEGANPTVAKSRTFKDLAVFCPDAQRLAGLLQVTIPTRGNLSAKYACRGGNVSFSTTSWSAFDPETKMLSAELVSKTVGYSLLAQVDAEGGARFELRDPAYDGRTLTATSPTVTWSKTDTAEAWQGYYTVALPVENVAGESFAGLAPTGSGYLTLKMNTASAWQAGRVTWAGMLPNGVAISGTSVLSDVMTLEVPEHGPADWACLPIFKVQSTDAFSAYARICAEAEADEILRCVEAVEGVVPAWDHREKTPDVADWSAELGLYGSYYDAKTDLAECCTDYYETTDMELRVDVTSLGNLSVGLPQAIEPLQLTVDAKAIKIVPQQANPAKATLSLNRSTGVVSGAFKLSYATPAGLTKQLSATYKGVVVTGWGRGCGCGDGPDYDVYLPFVSGSYYLSDKVTYPSGKTTKTLSVKRGGSVVIDAQAALVD